MWQIIIALWRVAFVSYHSKYRIALHPKLLLHFLLHKREVCHMYTRCVCLIDKQNQKKSFKTLRQQKHAYWFTFIYLFIARVLYPLMESVWLWKDVFKGTVTQKVQ